MILLFCFPPGSSSATAVSKNVIFSINYPSLTVQNEDIKNTIRGRIINVIKAINVLLPGVCTDAACSNVQVEITCVPATSCLATVTIQGIK